VIIIYFFSSHRPKKGTQVKSIRLCAPSDGHEVDYKMDAGNFMLKASFLKEA
jgi:protein PhnA